MLEWFLSLIDSERVYAVSTSIAWHGRGMVLAWCFLVPLAIVIARFFKVMPGQDWPREVQNPVWWFLHRLLGYGALGVTVLALSLVAVIGEDSSANQAHIWAGWTIVILAVVQLATAWARGTNGGPTDRQPDGSMYGDHYNMTLRRTVFEFVHKLVGYLLFSISILAILTGLWTANAPIWMWIVQSIWWLLMGVIFISLQRRGRAIDTYQAIWGTNPKHPGNLKEPIGLSMRRGPLDVTLESVSIRRRLEQLSRKKWWQNIALK